MHEQVKATAARGHEMSIRVQRIEAELPVLEKAVMAQTSHIHFAYTEGLPLIRSTCLVSSLLKKRKYIVLICLVL